MSRFQRPTSGDGFSAKENLGRLALFENIQPVKTIQTANGDTETVPCDVTVIDAPDGPREYLGGLVFGRALVAALSRAKAGEPLLARIGQGQAKAGQSAPWVLQDYTEADERIAAEYLDARISGRTFQKPSSEPAPTQAAPAPAAPPAATGSPTLDATQLTPEQIGQIMAQLQSAEQPAF